MSAGTELTPHPSETRITVCVHVYSLGQLLHSGAQLLVAGTAWAPILVATVVFVLVILVVDIPTCCQGVTLPLDSASGEFIRHY